MKYIITSSDIKDNSGANNLFERLRVIAKGRNRAFTSISRSKGWCRISGVGTKMDRAIEEIKQTLKNIPKFIFSFPDPVKILKYLSQEEYAKMLREKGIAAKAIDDLLALEDPSMALTEEQKNELRKRFGL